MDFSYRIHGECKGLRGEVDFSYRILQEELVFAFTVCQRNVSFATTLFALASGVFAREHNAAIKKIATYLRATRHYGLLYWLAEFINKLPKVECVKPTMDGNG